MRGGHFVVVLAVFCFLHGPDRSDAGRTASCGEMQAGVGGCSGIAGRAVEAPVLMAQAVDFPDARPGPALEGYYRAKKRRDIGDGRTGGDAAPGVESETKSELVNDAEEEVTPGAVVDGRYRDKKKKEKKKAEEVSEQERESGADVARNPGSRVDKDKNDNKNKNEIRPGDIFVPAPGGGAVNSRNGQFYPGTPKGIIDSQTGRFMPKVKGGYIDSKTGFHPIRY